MLEEKLAIFSESQLVADTKLAASDLKSQEINIAASSLGSIVFERGVSFQSQAIAQKKEHVFFGAYSYMNSGGYVRDGVFVGRYCSIGRRVTIGAGMHAMHGLSTSPVLKGRGSPYSRDQRELAGFKDAGRNRKAFTTTILENDVWVGDGAVILPGVRVCSGAVIGANAVVTRDVEPYSIVGGVPAKPIGERFSILVVEQLLQTRYWNCSREVLKSLPCNNVFEFIEAFKAQSPSDHAYETFEIL